MLYYPKTQRKREREHENNNNEQQLLEIMKARPQQSSEELQITAHESERAREGVKHSIPLAVHRLNDQTSYYIQPRANSLTIEAAAAKSAQSGESKILFRLHRRACVCVLLGVFGVRIFGKPQEHKNHQNIVCLCVCGLGQEKIKFLESLSHNIMCFNSRFFY